MNRIEFGDCRETLRRWAAQGVKAQMCVTSPPYFGLRSYLPAEHSDKPLEIGLEQTPDQFISGLVDVFRAVRDVLADDGTLWVNIGDSYAQAGGRGEQGATSQRKGRSNVEAQRKRSNMKPPAGLKPKDLIGIPWMLAFALRADGWYLRQDIIWHKPNPMPESVRDRCTKAHEYVFLLSKSERYFFDSEAMLEDATTNAPHKHWAEREHDQSMLAKKQANGVKGRPVGVAGYAAPGKRNRRSVWTVATRPYKGAHFATYPPALIEPCILAGSRPGDTVLDPFMGSGTTAEVAVKHGRAYLGCKLNAENGPLQAQRIGSAMQARGEYL
jgi:DNA modification methylase